MALQSSGYLAETFRAGIEAVPRGHREAGLRGRHVAAQTFTRIVMPQVAPDGRAVDRQPVHGDREIIDADLGDHGPRPDVQSQRLVNIWYEPIEILTATAAIYITFVFLVSIAGKLLSDRLRQRYGLAAS